MRFLSPTTLIVVVIAAILMIAIATMPSPDEVNAIEEQTIRIEERLLLLRIKAAPFLYSFERPNDEEYEQLCKEAQENLQEHLANTSQ